MPAPERDYLVAFATAKRWLEQELGGATMLGNEQIEGLVRAVIDAVDDARARRQQEH